MQNLMKFLGVCGLVVLCLSVATVTPAAITQIGSENGNGNMNMYNPCGYNGGGYAGCDPSRYPGSTEYCYKWIPEHYVRVPSMVPGRWEYRPMWVPGYQTVRYQKVQGTWQVTGSNVRPDTYIWGAESCNAGNYGAPNCGGYGMQQYGMPYQYSPAGYQQGGYSGGYFDANGVWRQY